LLPPIDLGRGEVVVVDVVVIVDDTDRLSEVRLDVLLWRVLVSVVRLA